MEQEIKRKAEKVLDLYKVAIFIVAYNAEKEIQKTLSRIPSWIAEKIEEIYIIDDYSKDKTFELARNIHWPSIYAPLSVYQTPYNQGYGGNQQLGYLYAIKKEFDIVVLLHADGQYAPEYLPHILAPYCDEKISAVFGSRFMQPFQALRGKMPLYKWLGNIILTKIQNCILKTKLSEMHSGYRSYRTSFLKKIPFQYNSHGFDFDADIIIQIFAGGFKLQEVSIPTYYGDEICHVNGLRYAWKCIQTFLKYRLMKMDIFYDPKFDLNPSKKRYTTKEALTSLHHYMRNIPINCGVSILDVGGGMEDAVSKALAKKNAKVTCIDQLPPHTSIPLIKKISVDLDAPWVNQFPFESYHTILALDILEHLISPEKAMHEIYIRTKQGGKLYASTANVAFILTRVMLLCGQFNYGPRGILDFTHKRLFTKKMFKRLLENSGFRVDTMMSFPPPISDVYERKSRIFNLVDKILFLLARCWPSLFGYQILAICTKMDSADDLMHQTFLMVSTSNGDQTFKE